MESILNNIKDTVDVLEIIKPVYNFKSAVDFGCGIGAFLVEAVIRGIEVLGIDGDYINRDDLLFPDKYFYPFDLSEEMNINKKYALDNCTKMNQLVINDYVSSFDIPDFKNLDTFLNAIKEKIPGMEDLNTRAFVDNYLMNYGPSMLFGIEYLPYFIGNLSYVEVGAMLNEQIKIENYTYFCHHLFWIKICKCGQKRWSQV